MRLPSLCLATLVLVLSALPATAGRTPPSTVMSDPSLAPAGCAQGGVASTGDVAVHGRTVAVSWIVGDDAATGLAVSRDGGRRFTRRVLPLTSCTGGPSEAVLDPDLAVGADGAPWVTASGPTPSGEAVRATTDGNELFVSVGGAPPVSVLPGTAVERGFLETDPVDPDAALVLTESITSVVADVGPVPAGTFVPGGPEGSLLLGRTADRGRTWDVTTLRAPSAGTQLLALGLVRTGGTLVALSVEVDLKDPAAVAGIALNGKPRATIAAQRSEDGGRTWSAPVALGVADEATLVDASAGGGLVAVAAAQFDGALLTWTSADAGRTWRQTTAASGVTTPSTAVAVDDTGRIGVLSYAEDGTTLTPQLSTSRDGGRTYGAPVPLGPSFDAEAVGGAGHVAPLGAYQGGAGYGAELLIAFTQGLPGRTEVRLARVR